MRGVVVPVALAALAAGACGVAPTADLSDLSPTVTTGEAEGVFTWTVAPWPFDASAVVLCLRDPGSLDSDAAFQNDPACTPLPAESSADVLTVEYRPAALPPAFAARLEQTPRPWSLVLSGQRGMGSFSMTYPVMEPPVIRADPGPS